MEINKCMGDPDADDDNPVLKAEQDAQVGTFLVSFQNILYFTLHSYLTPLILLLCAESDCYS